MLEHDRDWTRLANYAALLFRRTHDVPSCQLFARSLFETANFDGVVELLRANDDLLSSSEHLQSLLAWSLFNLGNVSECLNVLTQLRTGRDTQEDRALAVNVAIASGDWYSLASYVEREWERRAARSAEELLRAGQIAQQLTSARTRALIAEAAAKATDDPHVLLECYSSAMAAGWEDEDTFKWIERAETLSTSDGPIQRVSLKDLIDRHPDWQRRETEAWDKLNAGVVPMVACARMLNRSLVELLLLPALANSETIDPRRRTLLYSYSGTRSVRSGLPQIIVIDPTALLTAGMFGLLEQIASAVSKIVVPHSTLRWLFEERRRIGFHQPSRVADAREIRRLVDDGVLKRIESTAPTDEQLANEVGQELACLFAEAEADWSPDRRPRRVVRSGPIHRVESMMEEEADLGSHRPHVCGCLDVIDALVRHGCLTRAEECRARAFLSLHETPWTGIASVAPGSVLYMDSVSLSYFQHLRLLSKVEASGLAVVIPASEVAEGDRLIRYEALAERASAVIENIRTVLSNGIIDGKVILAPSSLNDGGEDDTLDHPAVDIIRITALAEVAIIDDRYFNQHSNVSRDDGSVTPIWTTYDLLCALQLAEDPHTDYLSRMRSAGLAFVPVNFGELNALLSQAKVANGALVESAELKRFRENLQLCRMSTGLQLLKESNWFGNLVRVLIATIKAQWREDVDLGTASARSTWLLELLDIRGWSHRYVDEQDRGGSQARFRAQLVGLMTFTHEGPSALRKAYWEWLDRVLLDDVRETQSDLHGAVIQDVSNLIKDIVARGWGTEDDAD